MNAPIFFDVEDVLLIHDEQRANTVVPPWRPGSPRVRRRDAARDAGGGFAHENLFAMPAAYAFYIAQNQPFTDGTSERGCSGLSCSST